MNIIVQPSLQMWGEVAAAQVARQIREKPNSVLGFATGNTTVLLHAVLVTMTQKGEFDFSAVVAFTLDEYVGLPPEDPLSCSARMEAQLFRHVNIAREHIHFPDGQADLLEAECQRYEQEIQRYGGIDLQILGIGLNGHIGFNEPGTPFESVTHVAKIAPATRKIKSSFFGSPDRMPCQGITLGIKTIMQARKILLLACNGDKAGIIARALTGPVTPMVPASVLQLHPDLTVIVDRPAVERLHLA
jgi:glucosamine-6-phosphate deaminase